MYFAVLFVCVCVVVRARSCAECMCVCLRALCMCVCECTDLLFFSQLLNLNFYFIFYFIEYYVARSHAHTHTRTHARTLTSKMVWWFVNQNSAPKNLEQIKQNLWTNLHIKSARLIKSFVHRGRSLRGLKDWYEEQIVRSTTGEKCVCVGGGAREGDGLQNRRQNEIIILKPKGFKSN